MSSGFTLHLFGPPEALIAGSPMPRMKTRKGLWTLAILAMRHGREVQREWLAGTLWPDTDESQALTYLRQTLTDLRRALGPESYRLKSPTFRTLSLDLNDADADIVTFDRGIGAADPREVERAVNVYRGPLLEGCFEEWALADREARRQAYLGGLERLAEHAEKSGDTQAAVRCLRQLTAAEPMRESAYRDLMRLLAVSGEYAAASDLYRELRNLLHQEVGADVDSDTRQLYEEIRREAREKAEVSGAPQKRVERAAYPVTTVRRGRLPRPISEFIGREKELETVRALLAHSALVTLTGIGGVGKTRLAVQVAHAAQADYPDGAWFVDLAPLSDPTLIPSTIANALGLQLSGGDYGTTALGELLFNRDLLLILDNCEHLLPGAAIVTAAILHAAPRVRILATSRQRLGVTGEAEHRVPPLTVPNLDSAAPFEQRAQALVSSESMRLFMDRARQVQPSAQFEDDDLIAASRVCRRLDGIPLALELAASRLSVLTPAQLDDRLEERFRLLVGGDRAAHPRQHTLRAMLDWSHDLLSDAERLLLRRLAVFSGGWTLGAAESVCSGPDLSEGDVLEALASLVDRSLVTTDPGDRGFRYRMLETVRHYSLDKLARSGEEANVREKHLDFFAALADEAASHIFSAQQKAWLDHLDADHDNFRAALDRCMEDSGRVQIGMRLAGALQRFWLTRGYLSEGVQRYEALLRMDAEAEPTESRGRALQGAGNLASRQGDYSAARRYMDEALQIARETGDIRMEASVLTSLGNVEYFTADYNAALELFQKALTLHRESGNLHGTAMSLHGLAGVDFRTGKLESARRLYEEALRTSRSHGDSALEAAHLTSLGLVALEEGKFSEARGRFRQSIALQKELGDPTQELINLNNLGMVAQKQGDTTDALRYYCEGLSLAARLGRSSGLRTVAHLLEGISVPLNSLGSPHAAARSLCAADTLRETIGVPRTSDRQEECEEMRAILQDSLTMEIYEVAQDSARRMTPEQAVQDALAAAQAAFETARDGKNLARTA